MTETDKAVNRFINAPGGFRYEKLFSLLIEHGLKPLGKSNTETLLFQHHCPDRDTSDVLAFRLKPEPVISFPKSFWLSKKESLNTYKADFVLSEMPATTSKVSSSQYSAAQILINRSTYERIYSPCNIICSEL